MYNNDEPYMYKLTILELSSLVGLWFWCPYMAINVSYSSTVGFSPILYHIECDYIGNHLDTTESFCSYSQCSHLNILTSSPLKVDAQKVLIRLDFS